MGNSGQKVLWERHKRMRHRSVCWLHSHVWLCDPVDCSPACSSVHRITQERILAWVAIPFSRGSSKLQDWAWVSCIAGRFFTREARVIGEETQMAKGTYAEKLQCNRGTTGQNACQMPFHLHTQAKIQKSDWCWWQEWGAENQQNFIRQWKCKSEPPSGETIYFTLKSWTWT